MTPSAPMPKLRSQSWAQRSLDILMSEESRLSTRMKSLPRPWYLAKSTPAAAVTTRAGRARDARRARTPRGATSGRREAMEVTACMAIARGAKCAPHAAAYPATRVGADRAIAGAGRPPLFGAFAAFGQAKSSRRTSVRCTARIATSRVQIHRATSSSRPHTHFRLLCASRAAATARTHPPAATATAAARVVASPGSHPPPNASFAVDTTRDANASYASLAALGMRVPGDGDGVPTPSPGTRESPSRGSPTATRSPTPRPRPAGSPRVQNYPSPSRRAPSLRTSPSPEPISIRARGGRDVFGEASRAWDGTSRHLSASHAAAASGLSRPSHNTRVTYTHAAALRVSSSTPSAAREPPGEDREGPDGVDSAPRAGRWASSSSSAVGKMSRRARSAAVSATSGSDAGWARRSRAHRSKVWGAKGSPPVPAARRASVTWDAPNLPSLYSAWTHTHSAATRSSRVRATRRAAAAASEARDHDADTRGAGLVERGAYRGDARSQVNAPRVTSASSARDTARSVWSEIGSARFRQPRALGASVTSRGGAGPRARETMLRGSPRPAPSRIAPRVVPFREHRPHARVGARHQVSKRRARAPHPMGRARRPLAPRPSRVRHPPRARA